MFITFLRAMLKFSFCALLLALFATCFSAVDCLGDLAAHFMLQYAVIATITCMGLWLTGARKWLLIPTVCIWLIFSLEVACLFLPRPIKRSDMYEDITLMQFNINYSNPNAKAVAGWINNYATINASIDQITQQELPDIVVLQEVSPEIAAQMMLLTQTYPYHFIAPKAGAFGVAIFSRIPIRSSSRKNFTGSWNEYTEIQFHTLATGITILLTELHTIPPVNRDAFTQRNRELREIASIVSQRVAGHSIVIGDMNITPYSRWFRELEQRTGLHNAMQGKNIAGTWPSFLPVPLRIPIDNMLVSDTIEVLERRVEKNLDSDHLPVVTKLRIYATN